MTVEDPIKISIPRAVICALVVAAVGCSGDEGGGGGAALGDATGETGGETSPGGPEIFTGGDGGGVGGFMPSCAGPGDCDDGALCDCTGTCRVPAGGPCTESKNCGSGTWCDPCSGHCEATAGLCEPCTQAGACGYDGDCVPFASGGSFCGAGCLTDAGCSVGYWCVDVPGIETDQCVPASGSCSSLGLCGDDGDCPDGEICNDALKQCGQGCSDDGQCPVGEVCTAGRCGAPCVTDGDCLAPAVCDPGGHCKIPGACESSAECEPAHHCDKLEGACVQGCLVDTDCQDASLVCEGSQCVSKGCVHNYQCAFGQECDAATGLCLPMADPHCSPCDAGAEEPAAVCGGEPNLCASFKDKDDVDQGDFCLLLCADDPVDTCPMGYGCIQIQTDDGSIDGYYCTRECWIDPVGGAEP